MKKQSTEKAYYIDDGIVISGTYAKRKFTPEPNVNCGFDLLLVTEDMFGKELFFNKKLAEIISSQSGYGRYEVVVNIDTHHKFTKVVEADSAKDALDIVADFLHEDESGAVMDWYDVLENYSTDTLEEYLAEWDIVSCGAKYALYLSLFEVVRVGDAQNSSKKQSRIIASKTVYNPIAYLEGMTGNCYVGNVVRNGYVTYDIDRCLNFNNIHGIQSFPLNSIERAIKSKKQVVLVDCSYYRDNTQISEYRWFQINDDFLKNLA